MLRIGTKLGLGISILLALCIIIGLVSYTQTRHVRLKIEEMTQVREPVNSAVYALENNLVETGFATLGYLSTGDSTLLLTLTNTRRETRAIQQRFTDVAIRERGGAEEDSLRHGFNTFQILADGQIRLRDLQAETLGQLFQDLDSIDDLLTERIQASVTVNDPVAFRRLQAVLEMKANLNAITKGLGNFLLTGDPQFELRIRQAEEKFKEYFTIYRAVMLTPQEELWSKQLRRLSVESLRLARSIIDIDKVRRESLAQFLDIDRRLGATLYNHIQLRTETNLASAKQDVLDAGNRANTTILLVLMFSVAFGVIAGIVTTKKITGPIQELASVMQAIAGGDRIRSVTLRSSDELRSLGEAFNRMTSRLWQANEDLRAEITGRQEAQEALRNSEERFRLSIDGVKDYAIYMLDPGGRVATWNAGAERIKGYSAGEIIGRHCSVFYPGDVAGSEEAEQTLQRAAAEERVESECVRVRKDGSKFWANVVLTAVRDGAGTLIGYSTVTRDITERKAIVQRLQESEVRFRTIFEDAPIGIALSDQDGHLIQTNPALQEMLGCSDRDLTGKAFSDVFNADENASGAPVPIEKKPGRPGRYRQDVNFVRRDGSVAWANLNVSPMHAVADRPSYSIMMIEDITSRRATDKQMRMLAHTITSMNESVVITDSDNIILSVNPAFTAVYGYAENEVLGKNAGLLALRQASAPQASAISKELLAGGWTGELLATRKTGEHFPVLLSTSVVRDDTGAPIAIVSISRDITEQKRLQQQLNDAERQRMAALRRFAVSVQRAQEEERGRISRELHDDICQRLSGMKLAAEVIADQIRPENKRANRRMRDFAGELDHAISEVRRISSNLRPSVLDDFGLVIALKILCREFESLHDVRTSFELGTSAPRRLDPNIEIAVYRIAQEALSNIAKHARASTASLHLLHHDSSLRLIVEDDGDGFSGTPPLRARETGHGFGLISMRERTELLGGRFEVDSAPRKGTTISVTIPLGEQTEHEENADSHR